MIDISIKQIYKSINNSKKALSLINKHLHITEKFDGTKLNLIRNNQEYDLNDHTKNWIVAYKGNIIFSEEFDGFKEKDRQTIKETSIAWGQYVFIHDHLRKIHVNTKSIPKNTEFFIEFIQNKPTLTRQYKNKHNLYLLAFGETKYDINGITIHSSPTQLNFNKKQIAKFAKILSVNTLPVLFDGKLTIENAEKVIPQYILKEIDFSDPMSVISGLNKALKNFESSIGGTPEGAVIETEDGEFYKVVQDDQYSKDVRNAIKLKWKMDETNESLFWSEMKKLGWKLFYLIDRTGTPQKILKELSEQIYGINDIGIVHSKKSSMMIKEDLFGIVKTLLKDFKNLTDDVKTVGVFPMAGRPVHSGHWHVINVAAKENDLVFLYVSMKDRKPIGQYPIFSKNMIGVWEILKLHLPLNVEIRYVDSPVLQARYLLQSLNKEEMPHCPKFVIYSGSDQSGSDIEKNWSAEKINDIAPGLYGKTIITKEINREETDGISGTAMREFLKCGDFRNFMKFLPQINDFDKAAIWTKLRN